MGGFNKGLIKEEQIFTDQDADYTSDLIEIGQWTNFAIQVNYSNSGTLKVQGSIDKATWTDLEVDSSGNKSITMDGSSELINFRDIGFPYIRVDIAGSVTGADGFISIKS